MIKLETANFVEKIKFLTSRNIGIAFQNTIINNLPMNEIRKLAEQADQTITDVTNLLDQKILAAA